MASLYNKRHGFQSTLPAWGETGYLEPTRANRTKFQSTLPAWGETRAEDEKLQRYATFQSTLPAWGETLQRWQRPAPPKFQSTLPAWGETGRQKAHHEARTISIHSPRMGRDGPHRARPRPSHDFNPLSPHGERRHQGQRGGGLKMAISIHSPRMGRDRQSGHVADRRNISIHSPRMGRDPRPVGSTFSRCIFQSTLPAWGETRP